MTSDSPSGSDKKFSVGTLDDQPAVAQTVRRLQELIEAQLARHERRLPPERQLAQDFGVGRSAIRRALAVLEEERVLVRHVGRGTYIAAGAGATPQRLQALATQGAQAIGAVTGLSANELLQVRYAIEPAVAELAALSARAEDVESMRKCLLEREKATHIDDYEHWDYALHRAIAVSTRNAVLLEILELVNRLRQTSYWRRGRRRSIMKDQKDRSDAQHRAIIEAIASADPALAFELMQAHVTSVISGFDRLTPR